MPAFSPEALNPRCPEEIDIQMSLLGKMLRHKTPLSFVCSPGVTLRSSDDVFIDRLDQLTVRDAAGQFTTFNLPAYAESVVSGGGAFALAYAAKSVTDTHTELGLRTDKSFALANGILTLRGRAAWAHDFNPDRSVGATFQALPRASFVVNGARAASESVLTTASAEMKWINGWSAAATFEGEFSNVTRSYAGKGALRYAW
jgi:hypothetical protein